MIAPGARPAAAVPPAEVIGELSAILKLLSDATRLRILLCLMRNGELHVARLCDLLGHSQPAISHHLGLLRTAGVIEVRRDGKFSFYRILPRRLEHVLELLCAELSDAAPSVRFRNYRLARQARDDAQPDCASGETPAA